jgi:putative membrane protein insertion efficiency factor
MTRLSLIFIRVYQRTLGPVFGLFSQCRYEPTCSRYGYEALQRYGFRRGWWLAIRRVSRCAPWGGSGPDPVPDTYVSWRTARRLKHAHSHGDEGSHA